MMLEERPPLVPPKFATQRDERYPTRGPRQAAFGKIWLGRHFMPWQQHVADVAGEYDPATGLARRSFVVVTAQRQAGKSDLALSRVGERAMSRPHFRAWYTAQTGADARDQFLKFKDETLYGTPLERAVRCLVGNGREVMRFPNDSTLRPHPPTEKALHGKQSDLNDIDEGWAFSLDEGKALLQAIGPTQLTRPGAQTWVWSAGGTAQSTWLAELVARGRGGDPEIAYFEWGIPDDLDLDDLESIARHHPAYGYTVSVESLRALRTQLTDDSEWARAAGNRWTEIIGGAITAEAWKAVSTDLEIPEHLPLGWGAARAQDGSQVVIAAAARLDDGRIIAEIVDVVDAYDAKTKVAAWAKSEPIAVDPTGPSATLREDLEDMRGVKVLDVSARDIAAGVARFNDALKARAWLFRPHPALEAAMKVAGQRQVGDGGVAWARVAAGAPIAAIEAANAACIAVDKRPAPAPKPAVRFAS